MSLKSICAAAASAGLLLSAGCASGPKPTADLTQAHTLISEAEQSGAQQYASADLVSARDKAQEAEQDAKSKPEMSIRLAQESSADAQLALARTRAAKAEQALKDVNAGTEALRNEAESNSATQGSSSAMPMTSAPVAVQGPQ
jgi:hypothetical protein